MTNPLRVVFYARVLTHYRVEFHERVRKALEEEGVEYALLYSRGRPQEEKKDDIAHLEWASEAPVRYFGAGGKLTWQVANGSLKGADLVIIGQENVLLHNYPLILKSRLFGEPKVAFFGHGRGFQAENPNGLGERFKRFWASKVDWWFAYTPEGARAVVDAGFPQERITVFNNAIDTSEITRTLAEISDADIADLRASLVGGSEHVGVYVGGIYAHKRIGFLLEAAQRIRARVPDFHLLVIGGGPDAHLVQAAAAEHDWIHALGPRFGRDKSLHVSLARVFLMPGLVGLAVLDAFAYGTPMVTTDLTYHSPEFEYLRDGENGLVVADADSADAYAAAVTRVLTDDDLLARLAAAGAADARLYTIENMADRFAQGVLMALRQ